ncbi:ABC transporter, ATP-binding domain protein [Leptospira inadai serovar Lyme str. 10]|uniref:ABC transporter, ATP-binding domain protein n=1 Tax=Leptospira inadai serovar Lyme str. 10 TaxID=1049790 RepID=V6HJW3_9LEPT|nr:ABC transporter permease [Leptospira inadai]EQA37185.1 ABC transporter, ATP-binding domain protein [Leptospira inadai serovar Lyme str. 10]
MPLFFVSNAIYPIEIMSDWLKVISHVNSLTYVIDALRSSMPDFPLNFGVPFISSFLVVLIGGRLYKRVGA